MGMSLGGLTAIRLAATRPDLVRRLAVVDVTPGVTAKSAPIAEFVQGPEVFGSFDELLERTITYNPSRSVSSLRRGVLHNARELPGGRWAWRYDRLRPPGGQLDFAALWADLAAVTAPVCWSADQRPAWSATRTEPNSVPAAVGPAGDGRRRGPLHPGRPAGRAGRADRRLRIRRGITPTVSASRAAGCASWRSRRRSRSPCAGTSHRPGGAAGSGTARHPSPRARCPRRPPA